MIRYPKRLAHKTPSWVESGATYHIRIRVESVHQLTISQMGEVLLASARFYHEHNLWSCRLFLLMPDHLHALLVFPSHRAMGEVVGAWKGYQTKRLGIGWQINFFDHRIRGHHELEAKAAYIKLNPVVKGLCPREEDWPWVISCEP